MLNLNETLLAKFLFHLLYSFAVSSHEQRKVWNWKKKLFHTTFQSTTNFLFSLAKNGTNAFEKTLKSLQLKLQSAKVTTISADFLHCEWLPAIFVASTVTLLHRTDNFVTFCFSFLTINRWYICQGWILCILDSLWLFQFYVTYNVRTSPVPNLRSERL